ncbi:MAG: hypothetical protein JNL21_01805 [Myxococcales bacterium]|nr:hypothetical protein [Myxococcales bacterium]
MLTARALVLVAAFVSVVPVASEALADSPAQSKPKASKEGVMARRAKLAKASVAIRKLAKEPVPEGLTKEQRKAFDAEVAKLVPLAEDNDKVVASIDSGLSDPKSDLDSLSELGEEQQLKLQRAMEAVAKALAATSNLLKKHADTAQSISQNLK